MPFIVTWLARPKVINRARLGGFSNPDMIKNYIAHCKYACPRHKQLLSTHGTRRSHPMRPTPRPSYNHSNNADEYIHQRRRSTPRHYLTTSHTHLPSSCTSDCSQSTSVHPTRAINLVCLSPPRPTHPITQALHIEYPHQRRRPTLPTTLIQQPTIN